MSRKGLGNNRPSAKAMAVLEETRNKHPWAGGYILEGVVYRRLNGRLSCLFNRVRVGPLDVGKDFKVQALVAKVIEEPNQ